MRIAIFDPGLSGQQGHHFDQDFRLARALRAHGHDVSVHGHAHVDEAIAARFQEIGVRLSPTFRLHAYARTGVGGDSLELWSQIACLTLDDLLSAAPFDVGFWPSLGPAQLAAISCYPGTSRMIGGLDGHIDLCTPFGAQVIAQALRGLQQRRGPVVFAAYDEQVATLYARFFEGVPLGRLPVPYDGCVPRFLRARCCRVGLFGHQRGERGAAVLPILVEGLLRRGLDVTVQDSAEGFAKAEGPRLRVRGFVQDFAAELSRCDAVIWPSMAGAYGSRSSGVVWEAIASGLPIVMPSGCLPAEIARRRGVPVLYGDGGVEAVLDAVDRLRLDYPSLAAQAFACAARWRLQEGVDRLAQAIVAGSLTPWPAC